MSNDNRKIDSSLLLILEMGTCALAAVSEQRLLALLIIKFEPLTSVHTSRSTVLCCEWWPGRRLACPVCLLGGRCDCRLCAGQDAMFSPPFPTTSSGGIMGVLSRSRRRRDVHVISHLLFTTRCSAPSSPTLSAAERMFPWQISFTSGGRGGEWEIGRPVRVPVCVGHRGCII